MVKIAPSLLSADFANLEGEIRKIEAGGAEYPSRCWMATMCLIYPLGHLL